MKHLIQIGILMAIAVFMFGCSDQGTVPTEAALNDTQGAISSGEAADAAFSKSGRNFTTHLTGAEEVPAVETQAQGQAIFHLSKDGTSLEYKLIVANIESVIQSHIHVGAAGANGPPVVFLFGPVAGGITHNGVLAEGTITEADFINVLAGQPFSALLDEINNGNTYVNVHTVANGGGEIRGQID